MATTTINNRLVPFWPSGLITLEFSAGRAGPEEAGFWEFWTVFNDTGKTWARCRSGEDPGERFRKMEGNKGYEKDWAIASAATGIREANSREVEQWLDSHPNDAPFVVSGQLGAAKLKLVRNGNAFRLELVT